MTQPRVEYLSSDYIVDPKTGEAHEINILAVPVGSRIYTPLQQEEYRKREEYNKQREQNELRSKLIREASQKSGKHFYFTKANQNFDDLSPETLARLIFLNTFLTYDSSHLMLTERTRMRRKDLESVLGISHGAAVKFAKECFPKYLSEDASGFLISNCDIFKRGSIPRKTYCQYERFYHTGIRAIYAVTDPKKHKHLGHIFAMLPFVNYRYNALCLNPTEQDVDKIDFLTLDKFCEMIGYDRSNISRLIKIYRNLLFEVDGHLERFVSFVNDCSDMTASKIYINPRIFYAGDSPERVEVLGAFCKI